MTRVVENGRTVGDPARLNGMAVGVLAVAAAVATSTSYVLQPELLAVGRDVGASLAVIGVVAGVPIVGYLVGLALLVPLADRVRSRWLVAVQLSVLAVGLAVAAVAFSAPVLGGGMLLAGLCASTGAQLSSIAGLYSDPSRRGRAVGTVTAGISAGIVLGRILGGTVADWLGWRRMLLVFAAACLVLALAALRTLPAAALTSPRSYLAVVRSLPALLRSNRPLRTSAVSGALWFFSFSLVWVGLSLALAGPPLSLSPARIGLYSLAGLLGVGATRLAGTLADRHGPTAVVLSGLTLAIACTMTMAFTLQAIPFLLIALALFDAGLFAAQVANQTKVLSLDPRRPAQLNSAYMVVYFIGGTLGTAVGGTVLNLAGWPGLAVTGTCALIAAAALVLRSGTAS